MGYATPRLSTCTAVKATVFSIIVPRHHIQYLGFFNHHSSTCFTSSVRSSPASRIQQAQGSNFNKSFLWTRCSPRRPSLQNHDPRTVWVESVACCGIVLVTGEIPSYMMKKHAPDTINTIDKAAWIHIQNAFSHFFSNNLTLSFHQFHRSRRNL